MSNDVPLSPIQQPFQDITDHLGIAFSVDQLRTWIGKTRNKPVIVRKQALRLPVWGMTVELVDAFIVYIRDDASPLLEKVTCCHEFAHILLGHLCAWNLTLQEWETLPDLHSYGLYRSAIPSTMAHVNTNDTDMQSSYDDEAESLAILLLDCVLMADRSVPSLAQMLYG